MNRIFRLGMALAIAAPAAVALPRPAPANPSLCRGLGGDECGPAVGFAAPGSLDFAHPGTSGAGDFLSPTSMTAEDTGIRHGLRRSVPRGFAGRRTRAAWATGSAGRPVRGAPRQIAVDEAVTAAGIGRDAPMIGLRNQGGMAAVDELSAAAPAPITACNASSGSVIQNCGFNYGLASWAWGNNSGAALAMLANPVLAYYGAVMAGSVPGANNRAANDTPAQTQSTAAATTGDNGAPPDPGDWQGTGSPHRGYGTAAPGETGDGAATDTPDDAGAGNGIDTVSDVPTASPAPTAEIVPAVSIVPATSPTPVAATAPAVSTAPIVPVAFVPPVAAGAGAPDPAPVPEPASLVLFATALAGFGLLRRKRAM
ncbi:MAG TPA: PEP-CTERM sorting domain-containing protein [Stellaceae bacterium]|nr:PEP-CTERM sorting domain-containing protein [Stellaceae bacterium]